MVVAISLLLLTSVALAGAESRFVAPSDPTPEYGHGLTPADMRAGWISLYDGQTSFGWKDAVVREGALTGGRTTSRFGNCGFRARVVPKDAPWELIEQLPDRPVRLKAGISVQSLCIQPILFPAIGKAGDADPKVIPHPTLPAARQATWQPIERDRHVIGYRAVGGPGCLELPGLYGDFILQLDVVCNKPLTNGGVFVRCRPGDFLNGYEAQVFNACLDGDPSKPVGYSTGGIDDRQDARRVVSRDRVPFTLTVVADGPHLATWVNGVQVADWTDTRPPNDNAREGLRLEPGTIQLQAHDKNTDVEYSNIRLAPLK
jgi:hypothetical protein